MNNPENNYFDGLIGQDIAKRKLSFLMEGYNATGILPHLLFIAPKGCGKTTLAKAVGRNLTNRFEDAGMPKKFYEINCSTIKNVKQLINQIVIPHVHGKECTILFDECSELPKDVTMALLTILNPNPQNRTSFSFEDYTIDFDFSRQTFMFATTEAHQVFHALIDRCDRIDLEEYTYDELAKIVSLNLQLVDFEDDVLMKIAPVLRGNARAAQKIANKISTYLSARNKDDFSNEDWEQLKYHLGILPLGLSRIELTILRYLAERKECSLTNLAAKTGLTPECIRRDFEMFLQKMGLMQITTKGRELTQDGHKYLKKVKVELEKQETAPACVKLKDKDKPTKNVLPAVA